jgi:hypothetical protein
MLFVSFLNWMSDAWVLGAGYWVMGIGYWVMVSGLWIAMDLGIKVHGKRQKTK